MLGRCMYGVRHLVSKLKLYQLLIALEAVNCLRAEIGHFPFHRGHCSEDV